MEAPMTEIAPTGHHITFAIALLFLLLPLAAAAGNLIINDVVSGVKAVVYEIPQEDGRAETVRSIESVRDRFFAGSDVVDATKADDSKLQDRLKETFALYTTLGENSRLLKAVTEPLHIQIDGNTLRWGELAVPISDVRMVLIGKNPYGDGYCVVYAAGTNQLLAKANAVFHGPCSYHIFQGGNLLKEGFYDERFNLKGGHISLSQAVEDVGQFFSTLQRVHPDLLANVNADEYIRLKRQTVDGVAGRLDKNGEIGASDLAYLLYYAAAFFGDGHTSVHWRQQPNESNTAGKRFPPFSLRWDNGQFAIIAAENKSLNGLAVLTVNGQPMVDFLRPILDRCSGETLTFKASRFTGDQAFWYSFTSLLGSAPSIKLSLRDAQGKESEQTLETVSFSQFDKVLRDGAGKQNQAQGNGTRVSFLDSDKVAYLVYPAFRYNDGEKKRIDEIFNQIKAKKSSDLIIDIRGNGGGTSNMGDFIFTYLHEGAFQPFSRVRVRLSRDVLSSVGKDWDRPESAGLEGMVVNWKFKPEAHGKPEAFYTGRAFLLVDNRTFSSATDFAAMFRDYSVGKMIGYETGGIPTCFGDQYGFSLKNSGIECGVSWKQFFGPKPRPGDDEHGVIPDVPMTDKLLKAYQKEDDPVLAYTLDYIKKSR
jgi:hypothetical protein